MRAPFGRLTAVAVDPTGAQVMIAGGNESPEWGRGPGSDARANPSGGSRSPVGWRRSPPPTQSMGDGSRSAGRMGS